MNRSLFDVHFFRLLQVCQPTRIPFPVMPAGVTITRTIGATTCRNERTRAT